MHSGPGLSQPITQPLARPLTRQSAKQVARPLPWQAAPSLRVPVRAALAQSGNAAALLQVASKAMPLRVLHEVDVGMPRSSAGRLVISGRMADVCAELDRLVEREAAMQTLH